MNKFLKSNFLGLFYFLLCFIFISFFFIGRAYSYIGSFILIISFVYFIVFMILRVKNGSWYLFDSIDYFSVLLFSYAIISMLSEFYNNSSLSDYELHFKILLICFIPLFCREIPIKVNNVFFVAALLMIFTSLMIALWQYNIEGVTRVAVKGANAFADIVSFFGVMTLAIAWYFLKSENELVKLKWVRGGLFIVSTLGFGASIYITILASNRGSWISLPLIIYIFSLVLFGFKSFRFLLSMLLIPMFFIILYYSSETVQVRVDQAIKEVVVYSKGIDRGSSVGLRFEMWRFGIDAVSDRMFLGLGTSGEQLLRSNIAEGYNKKIKDFSHLHNEFLNILVVNGFFALSAYILWLIYMLIFFIRSYLMLKSPLAFAGILGIIHYVFISLVNVKLSYNVGVYAFIIVFAFIYGMVRNEVNQFKVSRGLNAKDL